MHVRAWCACGDLVPLDGAQVRGEPVVAGVGDAPAAALGVGEDALERAEAAEAGLEARPVGEGEDPVVLRLRPQRVQPAKRRLHTPHAYAARAGASGVGCRQRGLGES